MMINLKPIKNYEDRYLVSDDGRVFSLKSNVFLRPFISKHGYPSVQLFNGKNYSPQKIHRLVAKAFIDGDYSLDVNHKDRNKTNNHVDNLEWCTTSENCRHTVKTGNPNLYWKPKQVMAVKDGVEYLFESIKAGARHFKCSHCNISKQLRGEFDRQIGGAYWREA